MKGDVNRDRPGRGDHHLLPIESDEARQGGGHGIRAGRKAREFVGAGGIGLGVSDHRPGRARSLNGSAGQHRALGVHDLAADRTRGGGLGHRGTSSQNCGQEERDQRALSENMTHEFVS